MRDTVIVGGGLAGLATGWRLRHQDVVLLESADRVGGRIRSERRGDYYMNWGGHVFASAPTSGTSELLSETGVDALAIPGTLTGLAMNGRLFLKGRVESYPFRVPMPWSARLALLRAGSKLALAVLQYARTIRLRLGEDEAARQQRVYDFMNDRTFADFLGALPQDARALLEPTVSRSAADLDEISAGAGVGYFSLVWNIGAGLGNNIAGGPSVLTETLAARLADKVQLNSEVVEVAHKRSSVVVRYTQGGQDEEIEARSVVLATPATVSHRIGVDLPEETQDALGKVIYGPYVSAAFLTNDTQPQAWDHAYAIATPGRSFGVALNMTNVIREAEDTRRPGSSLMVFSPARLARELLERTDEEIVRIYTEDLDGVLRGVADSVVEAQVQRWPLGAPYCFPGRGALQPALTKPTGRVFLAGDYLGTLYTETAIQTGFTAARRTLSLLERESARSPERAVPLPDRMTHHESPAAPRSTRTSPRSALELSNQPDKHDPKGNMMKPLAGVVSALATPFTAEGDLNQERLRQLIDRNIDGGVDGVVAGGSTGEFAAMTPAERRLLVETVIDQTAGRVPVVAQTGAMSTREAIQLSRHAEDAGADIVMLVAPYYEALTVEETTRYLRTVADSVQVPVMLYNLPAATGVNLTPDLVRQLATEVDNVVYVKDTTGDLAQLAQLVHYHGDVVSTFLGWDSLCLAALIEGAAGIVAGTANVIPGELATLHRLVNINDLEGARALWRRVYPLVDAMLAVPFIPAVKGACREVGFPIGSPRHPVLDLDAEALSGISTLVKSLNAASIETEGNPR